MPVAEWLNQELLTGLIGYNKKPDLMNKTYWISTLFFKLTLSLILYKTVLSGKSTSAILQPSSCFCLFVFLLFTKLNRSCSNWAPIRCRTHFIGKFDKIDKIDNELLQIPCEKDVFFLVRSVSEIMERETNYKEWKDSTMRSRRKEQQKQRKSF